MSEMITIVPGTPAEHIIAMASGMPRFDKLVTNQKGIKTEFTRNALYTIYSRLDVNSLAVIEAQYGIPGVFDYIRDFTVSFLKDEAAEAEAENNEVDYWNDPD